MRACRPQPGTWTVEVESNPRDRGVGDVSACRVTAVVTHVEERLDESLNFAVDHVPA